MMTKDLVMTNTKFIGLFCVRCRSHILAQTDINETQCKVICSYCKHENLRTEGWIFDKFHPDEEDNKA